MSVFVYVTACGFVGVSVSDDNRVVDPALLPGAEHHLVERQKNI